MKKTILIFFIISIMQVKIFCGKLVNSSSITMRKVLSVWKIFLKLNES